MIIVQHNFSCVFLCCAVHAESMVNLNLLEPYRNREQEIGNCQLVAFKYILTVLG